MKLLLAAKSTLVIQPGVTTAQIKRAEMIDPKSTKLFTEDGDVIFAIQAGSETTLSNAGLSVNDKKDFVHVYDKPVTKAKVAEDYGHLVARAKVVEDQILEAAGKEYDLGIEEVDFTAEEVEEA